MIKRVTWFLGGVAAGVVGVGVAKKKVKAAAVEFAPANVARKTTNRVKDAYHEGRRAMKAKEAELHGRLDGRVHTLADDLGDGDAVLVDGLQVEPGQVIVLKQVRDAHQQSGRRSKRA
jgi:hypothetical protein